MSQPRIFYYCYSHDRPNGGQKHTYRHVDILNANGFDAAIIHPASDFRLSWFDNETRVIDMSQFLAIVDPIHDFIVLPEDLGQRILEFPGRKVIFNKNLYHGFTCYSEQSDTLYPYHSPEVVAVFTVSRHNEDVLRYTYPKLLVKRMYAEIDPTIFRFCPLVNKRPQIVYVHKARESTLAIRHIIESRAQGGFSSGRQFRWYPLEDLSQCELAASLFNSLLLIFPSVYEGLPRMVLEAMASGCVVAAYGNGPLAEILPSRYSFQHSDLLGITTFVEEVMNSYPAALDKWSAVVKEGRQTAETFSVERQTRHLVEAWNEILQA
jgi:glycosyltransferase involved in cell wall biosynthesis